MNATAVAKYSNGVAADVREGVVVVGVEPMEETVSGSTSRVVITEED